MKHATNAHGSTRRLNLIVLVSSGVLLVSSLVATGCEAFEAGQRHAVVPLMLTMDNIANQDLYEAKCIDCHEKKPDPAEPYCFSGLSAEEHVAIWEYERAMLEEDPNFDAAGKALFESRCDDCHELPDPTRPGCFSALSKADVAPIHLYLEDVRSGKELFESDCRSCHDSLDPRAHDLEFWSAHMCNADEHLSIEQEQRVLLYLATRVD